MNYNSVILVGVVVLTAIWWLVYGIKYYPGPRLTHLYVHDEDSSGQRVESKTAGTGFLDPDDDGVVS
jgi:choline transport protein